MPGTADKAELREAIAHFSHEMERKLFRKSNEDFRGWDDPGLKDEFLENIDEHLVRLRNGDTNQAIDIANFAMFIWWLENGP